jgi:hypothetical protein
VKKALLILAMAILVGAIAFWMAKGANRGWTRTNIQHDTLDPVTGLSGVTYEKGFVPGVDFLAAAAFTSAGLAGGSCLIKNKSAGK